MAEDQINGTAAAPSGTGLQLKRSLEHPSGSEMIRYLITLLSLLLLPALAMAQPPNEQFYSTGPGDLPAPGPDIPGVAGTIIGGIISGWTQKQRTDCWHGNVYFVHGKPHPCTGYPPQPGGIPGRPNWPTNYPADRPAPGSPCATRFGESGPGTPWCNPSHNQTPPSQDHWTAEGCLNAAGEIVSAALCSGAAQAQSSSDFSANDGDFIVPGVYQVFEKTYQGPQQRLKQYSDAVVRRPDADSYAVTIKNITTRITLVRVIPGTTQSDPAHLYQYFDNNMKRHLIAFQKAQALPGQGGYWYSVTWLNARRKNGRLINVEEYWGQPTPNN